MGGSVLHSQIDSTANIQRQKNRQTENQRERLLPLAVFSGDWLLLLLLLLALGGELKGVRAGLVDFLDPDVARLGCRGEDLEPDDVHLDSKAKLMSLGAGEGDHLVRDVFKSHGIGFRELDRIVPFEGTALPRGKLPAEHKSKGMSTENKGKWLGELTFAC